MQSEKVILGRTLTFRDDPSIVGAGASFDFFETGALAISAEGKIGWHGDASMLPEQYRGLPRIDYENRLILPGFIDAHLHYPQYRMLAAFGKDLLDWLNRYTFVEEQNYSDVRHANDAAKTFLNELLQHGITGALAFSTTHPLALNALFTEAKERNMALFSGKTMMDRNAPAGLCDTADSSYDDSKALIRKWHGEGRLHYAISPRFAVTSTEAQLELAGALVREHPGLLMQTHMSENQGEVASVAADFPWSRDYTDVYDRFGLLGPKSLFAHGIHLSERELTRLNESRSAIVHCPTSNNFLGSGLFRYHHSRAKTRPVKVGIGCDIGGGTSYSMLQTLSDAYKVSQLAGDRISAFDGFYLATLGNARLLGIDEEIGSLDVGKYADLVVLDPEATPIMKARHALSGDLHDVLFALMIMGDDRAVTETYVAGCAMKSVLSSSGVPR